MAATPYYSAEGHISYVVTGGEEEWIEKICLHRGSLYCPSKYGGAGSFIADTGINLRFPGNGDIVGIKERSIWDTATSPDHKLKQTAHFCVLRESRQKTPTVVLSGWIVPYDSSRGIPMENRWGNCGSQHFD